jgi:hypothetical protein
MAKMQRRYREGSTYTVIGVSDLERKLKFIGRVRMGKGELLIFRPVRAASKFKKP